MLRRGRDAGAARRGVPGGGGATAHRQPDARDRGGLEPAGQEARADIAIEATGGITLANVRSYAEAGADFISIGALTHSVAAADISLEIADG